MQQEIQNKTRLLTNPDAGVLQNISGCGTHHCNFHTLFAGNLQPSPLFFRTCNGLIQFFIM